MELLLLTCRHILYAIEMKHVSRIIKISSIGKKEEENENEKSNHYRFLLEPANEEFGVLLTNNYVLPVDKVERMLHHEGSTIEANDFLKGCMKTVNIDGFVAINNKIYGMLNNHFLGSTDPVSSQPGHRVSSQPGHRVNSQPGHRVKE